MTKQVIYAVLMLTFIGCNNASESQANNESGLEFEKIAILDNRDLKEVSGIQSGSGDVFYVHNDSGGALVHIIDLAGRHQGEIRIRETKNRDWEDITSFPGENGQIIVMGDIGDNGTKHKTIRLYFIAEPERGEDGLYPAEVDRLHKLKAKYPDGPRDSEAMSYDPSSGMILFLTKRDKIPRIYGLPAETAFSQEKAQLEFLGEIPTFRPPTAEDLLTSGKRAFWLSQPTGFDISPDGKRAAVITYRSLYLYSREDGETWVEAFQKEPLEIIGPPGLHDEAVTFSRDGRSVFVSTERLPTPLYKLQLPEEL
jgi:hypothetical protein